MKSRMKEMLEIQGMDGNWNYDPYMHGLYNGMEFMLSIEENREPIFREAPKTWLSNEPWKSNFSKAVKTGEKDEESN